MEEYLISLGFKKEPIDYANRWSLTDGETHYTSSFYMSVTLTHDGSETLYGFIVFYSHDGNGNIVEKRKFGGDANQNVTKSDIVKMLDKTCTTFPKYIRVIVCK